MRLWHYKLIPYLPKQQLVGQWRECCAVAAKISKGTLTHILVKPVLNYDVAHFYCYSERIIAEMRRRKIAPHSDTIEAFCKNLNVRRYVCNEPDELFPGWHNDRYLRECLYNLEEKAICGGMSPEEWDTIYNQFSDFTELWNRNKEESL